MDGIEQRHEAEKAELEARIAEMLKGATSKNDKKRINKQAEDLRRDLFEKQHNEASDPLADKISSSIPKPTPSPEHDAPLPQSASKSKEASRSRRERRNNKQAQLDALISNVARNLKTQGDIETEKLSAQLAPLHLTILPVLGDGHCLFRAVAKSLTAFGVSGYSGLQSYLGLRQLAAQEMRASITDLMPFTNYNSPDEYESHCKQIESTAEWGDSLEVEALSRALKVSIVVHILDEPPHKYGEFQTEIHVSFHKFYTASGAHYNAVAPAAKDEEQ